MRPEPHKKETRVGMPLIPVVACMLMICALFVFGFAVQCANRAKAEPMVGAAR